MGSAPAPPHLPAEQVQKMFARVASRYDVANRVMTLGMDRRWRGLIQERAALHPGQRLLDLATGTGQLAFDARRRSPHVDIVATDLTAEMLRLAQQHPSAPTITWAQMDARTLAFADASFDVITHGYLLRYLVGDMEAALREQWRVLKPGGRLVALESSPGLPGPLGRTAAGITRHWPRLVGRVIAGNPDDYAFLQESTLAFVSPAEMVRKLERAGFRDCATRSYLQGMITVFWAVKPEREHQPICLTTAAGVDAEGVSAATR